jgi:shikimate kinase
MTIILQGMCYAGKTTLGELLGKKLNLPVLDSRDIFMDKYNISEVDYLEKYGREKFI